MCNILDRGQEKEKRVLNKTSQLDIHNILKLKFRQKLLEKWTSQSVFATDS